MNREEIVRRLRRYLPAILEKQPIQLAYLYGSVARDEITPFSDIDIALVGERAFSPHERLDLMLNIALEVEDRCGLQDVDVRVINDAPLLLQGRVVTEGILLYARSDSERVRYETATRMRYFDYLPIHQRLRNAFLANVREQGLYYGRSRSR
ncbi:MAG TPA: nucleotidyltransferase domain-containing protein [Caldilineae bacterium]|nr:nucleotidyltransferase domain-containing protein [Caldilineae bacterium]